MTKALEHRSGVENVSLDLGAATFIVEGVEMDVVDLKQTVETWQGYDYTVEETVIT